MQDQQQGTQKLQYRMSDQGQNRSPLNPPSGMRKATDLVSWIPDR